MTNDYNLYSPIVTVVRGYCKMYHFMKESKDDPQVDKDVRAIYAYAYSAISAALEANCRPDEAPYFVDDIGLGTGFNKSQMCFISECDYKTRKRKIVMDIAVNLRLV